MYFLYAILGGFKGRLHATGDVVYFLYAILGGFKGRLHATVDVVYFLYAILGGFKGRLHATVDVVYFLYAILGGFKGRQGKARQVYLYSTIQQQGNSLCFTYIKALKYNKSIANKQTKITHTYIHIQH